MKYDKDGLPISDRTRETEREYQHDKENGNLVGLLEEPYIVQYGYWKLIVNRYPYDARWRTCMLLVALEETTWKDLSTEAVLELHRLKAEFKNVFDKIEENGESMASIPGIPHVHLLQGMKR